MLANGAALASSSEPLYSRHIQRRKRLGNSESLRVAGFETLQAAKTARKQRASAKRWGLDASDDGNDLHTASRQAPLNLRRLQRRKRLRNSESRRAAGFKTLSAEKTAREQRVTVNRWIRDAFGDENDPPAASRWARDASDGGNDSGTAGRQASLGSGCF